MIVPQTIQIRPKHDLLQKFEFFLHPGVGHLLSYTYIVIATSKTTPGVQLHVHLGNFLAKP